MAKATIAGGVQGPSGPKGDKGDSGDMGNFTGIANFTDANGFTGNVTNNNLSLTLQYANSTQDGQVTSANFNDWQSKGTSNLTIGTTNTTAYRGDLGAGATSNITDLQNLTTNLSATSNTTTSILNGAVSNITTLQNQTTNLTESKLNITDALVLGSTNLTAYRGDLGVGDSNNISTLQGNVSNLTSSKQDALVSGTNIKTINGNSVLGSGDLIITGGGNITGIANFSDGNGFTGTVTNNSLSLVLQHANGTQDGQISPTNYNDWQGKGTSNLTIGNTTTTAFQGDLGQTAYNHSQITHDKAFIGLANVSDVTSLELPVSNATQAALDLKADKTVTINGQNLSSNITLNVSLFGDITGSGSTNITTTLATVNSNTGIFGNATVVPSITVNEKGLITAASNSTIPTANTTTTGLVTSTKYNDWEAKGISNLTIGTTTGTAYDGALGAGATSNITTLQGNVTNLTTDVNALNSAVAGKGTSNLSYVQGNGTVNGLTLTGNVTGTGGNLTLGGELTGVVFESRTINGQNLTANITTTHGSNSGLGWTSSGHTGSNSTVAWFNATGVASEFSLSGNGTAILTSNNAALGTPASGDLTNCNGTASGLTAGNVTNIPSLSGVVTGNATGTTTLTANGTTSAGVASWVSDETGTGSLVFGTNATLITPNVGTPSAINLTNAVGLPLNTGITGTLSISNGGTGASVTKPIAQFVSTSTGTVATGTTTIPLDNTIPQNTEGDQYMSLSITPKSATSTLLIFVHVEAANSVASQVICSALFQDSTANALACKPVSAPTADTLCNMDFLHVMTSGTTSATTFKVRVGARLAGTTTFNGAGGAQFYGGTISSSICIAELL